MTEDPRISEIRAVLTEYVSTSDLDAQLDVRRRIRAIVDREPPAPRVFFPGDTVPRGVATVVPPAPGDMTRDVVYVTPEAAWAYTATHVVVELPLPSVDDTWAAIKQAQAARADAEWQHTEGTNP